MYSSVKLFNRVQERQSGVYKNLPLTSKELTAMIVCSVMMFYITPMLVKPFLQGFWVFFAQGISVVFNIIFWICWALYMDDKPRYFFWSPLCKYILRGKYIGYKERIIPW